MKDNILLETGTGEVELLEFLVDGNHFGINVLKIKEIVRLDEVVPIPASAPAIAGKAALRNNLLTVVDLKVVLKNEKIASYKDSIGLLCEFNQTQVVFMVENVLGIKRFFWHELDNQDKMSTESLIVGTILNEGTIITLLDFESILIDLSPKDTYYTKMTSQGDIAQQRKDIKLVLADDSRVVREMLKDALEGSGYDQLKFFNNGQDAHDYIMGIRNEHGKAFENHVNLLITDIEMPMMDGYTLTRKIKEDEVMSTLPVIIFSSLITDDLYHKGRCVGAEAQISKPSLKKLVAIIDELVGLE